MKLNPRDRPTLGQLLTTTEWYPTEESERQHLAGNRFPGERGGGVARH